MFKIAFKLWKINSLSLKTPFNYCVLAFVSWLHHVLVHQHHFPLFLFLSKSVCEMNSLGPECNELKQKYDACFNLWFSEKFLKSGGNNSDCPKEEATPSMCEPIFVLYQKCVRVSWNLKGWICVPYRYLKRKFKFQNAIKAQKLDLTEIDKKILGTSSEKQRPQSEDNTDDKKWSNQGPSSD